MEWTSAIVAAPLVAGVAAITLAACADASGREHAVGRNTHLSQSRTTVATGRIAARVVLYKTTAVADGQPIHGYIEVNNNTDKPILLPGAPCDGWLQLGLVNGRVGFNPAFSTVGCGAGHLPIGTSRTPIEVETTYSSCHQGPTPEPRMPRCLGRAHNVMPDLPAGRYVTKTVYAGVTPRIAEPGPVHVTLTSQ